MTHHDNSSLVGSLLGAAASVTGKIWFSALAVITLDGVIEAGVYAAVGACMGFFVTLALKAISQIVKNLFQKIKS